MMPRPESPAECPICNRVEAAVRETPVLAERLSENELADIVTRLQSAILNKEITKSTRGINMADEKYVISKASFEDFYETQDTLVSIIEKMVDRIEKQDQVIMKFGAALSEIIAKDFAVAEPEAEFVEEEVDVEGDEEPAMDEEGEEEEEVFEEEEAEAVPAEAPLEGAAPTAPMPGQMKMASSETVEKAAFEAGYKAALAEMQKKNGVPVNTGNFQYPEMGVRAASTADVANAGVAVQKALTDQELGEMSPAQVNAWMRQNKLLG